MGNDSGGHFFHTGGFRGRSRFGFYLGSPFYWPSYSYWPDDYGFPYYYPAPTLVVPTTPPVYIEKEADPSRPAAESAPWAYCPDSEGYYPHVKDCPAGWRQISPQPEGQSAGYWYYCANPAGYYPYVRTCSGPWRQVVPTENSP